MKKFFAFVCVLIASVSMVRGAEPVLVGTDSLQMMYVPNDFKDNWELSIAGGPSFLWAFSHDTTTNNKMYDNKFFGGFGGGGEITATKWFNPYVGIRFGWYTEYLKWSKDEKVLPWNNYVHFDAIWDWTNQFGGVKDRVYTFAPYVHVGIVANIKNNVMVGGGVGFLNRFRLSEHLMLNIDLRGTVTSASKYGKSRGIGVELTPLVGLSYRFNKVGWQTKVKNPSSGAIKALQTSNDELQGRIAKLEKENQQLAAQAASVSYQVVNNNSESGAATGAFAGIPDTLHMTVYYSINASTLGPTEKAHLASYVKLIKLNDPNMKHQIVVRGTADGETGPSEFNKKLAADRANAIKQVLVSNGVPEAQITVETQVLVGVDKRLARASEVIVYPL